MLKASKNRNFLLFLANEKLTICVGLTIGLLYYWVDSPLKIFIIAVGIFTLFVATVRVNYCLFLILFITYANFSEVLVDYYGVPSLSKISITVSILVIMLRFMIYKEIPKDESKFILYISIYFLIAIVSMSYAEDADRTKVMLIEFAKDVAIAVIIIFLLKRETNFQTVLWALLLAGFLLGTIGVVQYFTGTFDNNYYGFGQTAYKHIVGDLYEFRIAGSIGHPNYFAQIMLPIIPLAVDRIVVERSIYLKILAAWISIVCFLSIIFTFSRGAFIALIIMLIVFIILHPPKIRFVIFSVALGLILFQFIPNEYLARIKTLQLILPGNRIEAKSEASYKGRTSEISAAYLMFLDHPIKGVGFANYEILYQKYSQKIFIDPRLEERQAHNRYLEILAETGLIGFTVFALILWFMFLGLWKVRKKAKFIINRNLQGTATALIISMVGFISSSLFLHNAYARSFWIMISISFALQNLIIRKLKTEAE